MIKSKKELKQYIEADLKALNCYPLTLKMRVGGRLSPSIFRFQIMMRKLEYDANVSGKNGIRKAIFWLKYKRYERYGTKLGFTIPINVFGPGLCLCHIGTVIINREAKVGANARVHAGVNIGNSALLGENWVPDNVPVIGDHVYIGPGAKLYGKIKIGDDVAIGANAVVNKDVADHVTVAGVPATVISEKGATHPCY